MKKMTMKTALDNLCLNYGKYGFTRAQFKAMLQSGIERGISVRGAYNGIRMIAAEQTGEHELFTSYDIADITGETIEEVNQRIEEYRKELIEQGEDPGEYFRAIEPIRTIIKL